MQITPSVTPVIHDLPGANRVSKVTAMLSLLSALLLTAGGSALAQTRYGTVFLNNYDSGKGIFWLCGVPALAGTYVEVLGGQNAGSLSPIASTDPGNPTRYTIQESDRDALGLGTGGFFDYGFGEVPNVLPGATATLVLRAWTGTPTYDSSLNRSSVMWTQQTGTNPEFPDSPHPTVLRIWRHLFLYPDISFCTIGPHSQTATAGAPVTFVVEVITGCPSSLLTYQWTKDGLDLNRATNATLYLTNVSRANAGTYTLTITNCGRTNRTIPATLRVQVPQRFEAPTLLADGRVRLPFRDQDGNVATFSYATNYLVPQISTNLTEWQAASGGLSATNGFLVFEEGSPSNSRNRFYRIVER